MTPEEPTRVFISYSHDSQAHADDVLALANRPRADGVDCSVDQCEESPPEGWPQWMERQIRESKFVLVVCSLQSRQARIERGELLRQRPRRPSAPVCVRQRSQP